MHQLTHDLNDQETFDWIVEYVDAVLHETPTEPLELTAALRNIQTVAEARRGEWK